MATMTAVVVSELLVSPLTVAGPTDVHSGNQVTFYTRPRRGGAVSGVTARSSDGYRGVVGVPASAQVDRAAV